MTSATAPAMVISLPVQEHLRAALLGATSSAVEEADKPSHPDEPGKRAAYHELMAALRVRYELQQAVGLPGEPLAEIELSGGNREAQAVVTEVLTDYRDATVALLGEGRLAAGAAEQAADRIEVINECLAGEQIIEGQEYHVA